MVQHPTPIGRVGIYQSDAQGLCVYVNTAPCEFFHLRGRIGTITDITEAKQHFPDEDSGSG